MKLMVLWTEFAVNKLEYLGMILGVRYFLLNFNQLKTHFINH